MLFLDLPWEDVLVPRILSLIPLKDLFRLRGVSKEFAELVAYYFSRCRTLDFSALTGQVPKSAFYFATSEAVCLQTLVTGSCKSWLSDSLLVPILTNNRKLAVLDLTDCMHITNDSLDALVGNCPHLESLSLHSCYWVAPEQVTNLALVCGKLTLVDLTGCWEVNDETIILLARANTELRSLSLAKIYGISDRSIEILASSCRKLQHLDIRGCWRVRDFAIRRMMDYCPQLSRLEVADCGVSIGLLSQLVARGVKVDVNPSPLYLTTGDHLSHIKNQFSRSSKPLPVMPYQI